MKTQTQHPLPFWTLSRISPLALLLIVLLSLLGVGLAPLPLYGEGMSNPSMGPPPDPGPISDVPPPTMPSPSGGTFMLIPQNSEAMPDKYRKIALNGRPLTDEKPQEAEESDQPKEETYVDAATTALSHSTTDIYIPLPGGQLALSVRRNLTGDIYSLPRLDGEFPSTRVNEPFGRGWSSNIGSYLKITTGMNAICEARDENGSGFRFVGIRHPNQPVIWNVIPSSTVNEAFLAKIESQSNGTMVLTKKYGTKLIFEQTDISRHYIDGVLMTVNYWRLRSVEDRYHNKLVYTYSDALTLVPSTIAVDGHASLKITIEKNPAGKINRIIDPMGHDIIYNYTDRDDISYPGVPSGYTTLTSVQGASNSQGERPVTTYDYDADEEIDPNSKAFHLNLKSITNPEGKKYEFTYGFDKSRVSGEQFPNPQIGQPRQVKTVTFPDGLGTTRFQTNARVWTASYALPAIGYRHTYVCDAEGNTRVYEFLNNKTTKVNDGTSAGTLICYYEKVVVYHYKGNKITFTYSNNNRSSAFEPGSGTVLLGTETYEFNSLAGGALKKVIDFSGKTTLYTHTASLPVNPDIGPQYVCYYPDPVAQTNAQGKVKSFTYENDYRMMTSITDEAGRVTRYKLDKDLELTSMGRRMTEEIYPNASATQATQITEFEYGNANFPSFVTKKTIKRQSGDPAWAVDRVISYTADANGRIATETVNPGGLNLTTSYTYDLNGNKITSTDPRGKTTYFTYDNSNRLVQVTYPPASSATDASAPRKTIIYDKCGNKTSETDELGNKTLFVYDGLNRLTQQSRDLNGNGVIDSSDSTTRFYYNRVNSKRATVDPRNYMTLYDYDALQRLAKVTDPYGNATTFEYGENSGGNSFDSSGFKPTSTTDARGYVTTVTYDALFRAIEKSVQYDKNNNLYAVTSTVYDEVGNPISVTDPLNHTTTTQYDALNRPYLVTNSDNTTKQIVYTGTGLKWKQIDELQRVNETEYDGAGRPVNVYGPEVDNGSGILKRPLTRTEYDAAGNVIATINPLENRWDFTYDARNRKITEQQPAVANGPGGALTRPLITTTYDLVGNVIALTDARGNTTNTTYDAANRPIQVQAPAVTLPEGGTARPTTSTVYDLAGNATRVTDPNGHVVINTYDALNRLWTTRDAANILVTNEYDAAGNRTAVIDGKSQRTEFKYDGLNRLTETKDPANQSVLFTYDGVNKTARVDSKGQRTEYAYDTRNRLTTVSYMGASGENRTYGYDNVGNLLSVTQPNTLANVGYTYDALNRQITETSGGYTHTYRYDLAGNRLGTIYGGTGLTLVSTYDSLNRLYTLLENGHTTSYAYDLGGNIVRKTLPNGDKINSGFDATNRTTTLSGVSTNSSALYTYTYSYDLASNVTRIVEAYPGGVNNRTVINSYDGINRLTNERIETGSNAVATSYAYDEAHNRKSKIIYNGSYSPGLGWVFQLGGLVTTYTYNSLNQLTATSAGDSYTYDLNGNRETHTLGALTDTYGYDYENRLVSLVKNISGTGLTTGSYYYTYDYRTRRVLRNESSAGGALTQVIFSGGTSCAEYVTSLETGLPSLTPDVEYLRGSDYGGGIGGILYTLRGGTPSYTHENRRGDVIAKTDGTGSLTYQAVYEAYGKRTQEHGSTLDRQKANTKDEDPTGLLNEGFRYRDLDTGTFITRDPLGFVDGPNMYAYVVQNPWTRFDPEGLSWLSLIAPDFQEIQHSISEASGGLNRALGAQSKSEAALGVAQTVHGTLDASIAMIPIVGGLERAGEKALEKGVEKGAEKLLGKAVDKGAEKSASKVAAENAEKVGGAEGEKAAKPKCFPAGTLVSTPKGKTKIEKLRVGDEVFAYDFKTHQIITRTITDTINHFTYFWVKIKVGDEVVTATRFHEFWVESKKEWVQAIDLKAGMQLRLQDGTTATIKSVELRKLQKAEKTYNLTVDSSHNYFVAQSSILVHNEDRQQTSRAARREAMRQQGIPTSQQPASQNKPGTPGSSSTTKQYTYDVPKEGGGTKTATVTNHPADKKHPNAHWEAADAKTDSNGEVKRNSHGDIKYDSDKSKVEYKEGC